MVLLPGCPCCDVPDIEECPFTYQQNTVISITVANSGYTSVLGSHTFAGVPTGYTVVRCFEPIPYVSSPLASQIAPNQISSNAYNRWYPDSNCGRTGDPYLGGIGAQRGEQYHNANIGYGYVYRRATSSSPYKIVSSGVGLSFQFPWLYLAISDSCNSEFDSRYGRILFQSAQFYESGQGFFLSVDSPSVGTIAVAPVIVNAETSSKWFRLSVSNLQADQMLPMRIYGKLPVPLYSFANITPADEATFDFTITGCEGVAFA
jgi:hypothetical protein